MFPNVSQFPTREILFPVSVFAFKMQIMLMLHDENPSMRALANFCEHEQASTHLIFASNSSKGQILPALSNWMGPFDTLISRSPKLPLVFV